MYSNNSLNDQHLSYQHQLSDTEMNMVSSNINASRIIHDGNSNEGGSNHLDIKTISDYSNGGNIQIVNYMPTEILHHHGQLLQGIKKIDANYMQSKEMHLYQGADGSSTIITTQAQQTSLPLLTPLKYVEYHTSIVGSNEDQMIINDESDKSDCESSDHKTPSKLPHKKRIAKKLNSNQPYNQHETFNVIMPAEESNMRSMQTTNHIYECNICGAGLPDQLEFFIHLKQHYEPVQQVHHKRKHEEQEDDCGTVENLIIDQRQHQVETLPEKLIESLEDSHENIKNEENQRETLPEIDEFNEFSEPEDIMEDLRNVVEKVVETIADNECMREENWNYQVISRDIDENDEQAEDLQIYSENLIQSNIDDSVDTNYDEIPHADGGDEILQEDTRNFDSDDDEEEDEDDKPLEQVRKSLQKSSRSEADLRKFLVEDDKEDLELTECLKKIHNFKCTTCNKAFNSRTALGYHLKTHTTERRYVCDQCGKKFLTNGALKVHQRLHTNDRPYDCKFPGCGKSFRQWGDLKYHETSIHSDKKDHVCEFCAKAFARKYSLVIHRRIHTGERNYKCTDCDKSFRASSYLLNHKRIHTGEKPYCCSVVTCLKKFRVVGDLKRHMKIHDRAKGSKDVKKKETPADLPAKKEKQPAPAIVVEEMSANDECVDLSFKEEKDCKPSLVFTNNEIDIYAKSGRKSNDKEESKKSRKSTKSRKAK